VILNRMKNLHLTSMINYVALAYAFTLPLSRASMSFFTGLLILLWVLDSQFISNVKQAIKNKVVVSLVVFFLLNLISLLWTDDVMATLGYIRRYWYILPVFVLFTSLKKEYIPKLVSAFILGMFVSEVVSYGVYFGIWEMGGATPANPTPFMHHIEYSIFLAFTALILLGRIFNEKRLKYTVLYIFFFATVSGNLFLTAGRTGQIAFILGLLVLAMLSFKNRLKAFSVAIILSVLVLGIAFNLSTTFHDRIIEGKNNLVNVVENQDYCSSWGTRVAVWVVSKDIMLKHPFLGIGTIDNMTEFHALINTKYPHMKCIQGTLMHMHNQYIQIFTQLGLIGLLVFLSIFYAIFRLPLKRGEYKNIKYVYLTILLFAFISEVILHRQFSIVLFTLISGLLLAQSRIENEV